jgi:S1-C subfamily serine protease
VIGINTAIIALAQGIGFAIPANTAKWVVEELTGHGQVRRPYLGITATVIAVPRSLVRELNLLSDRVVEVVAVESGGPASAGGVLPGDQIVAVNDRVVTTVDDLHRLLTDLHNQRTLTLTIVRESRRMEADVRPAVSHRNSE